MNTISWILVGVVVVLIVIISWLQLCLQEARAPREPAKVEGFEDVSYQIVAEGTTLMEVVHGNIITMQDFKNQIALQSEILQIEKGKAVDFEFKFDFTTGEYVLNRKEQKIDSTDDFY